MQADKHPSLTQQYPKEKEIAALEAYAARLHAPQRALCVMKTKKAGKKK